jgi:hypothetical protein
MAKLVNILALPFSSKYPFKYLLKMEKLEYLLKKNGNLEISMRWNADWFSLLF